MGKTTGFLEFERRDRGSAPVHERVRHWSEFAEAPPHQEVSRQASRCMDCGIPFCHTGCPVNNLIRSEEHTSELQSLMRISYAVFCLKKKKTKITRAQT